MKTDKDRARAKEMFRQMSPKEKCGHIFRYYWLHMVAVVVLLVMAVSLVSDVRESIAREDYLYVVLQEGYYMDLQPVVEAMAQEINWPEELNFSSVPSVDSQDTTGSYQLVLYLTADQVDFVVCDKITMQVLSEDDTLDLSVLPLEQTALGERVDFVQELYLIRVNDTGRQEKAEQFAPVLMGTAS